MKTSKVFVPVIPARKDHLTKQWLPTIDISPAEKFGDIVVMLPPDAHFAGLEACKVALKEKLRTFDNERDYLLCVGNNWITAAAAFHLGQRLPCAKTLVWNSRLAEYVVGELS